jgi:cytochrome oxidase Cu insertion factor (SCO1/SenC/PrrC family)|tara:strand:- start:166 stop:438 length:273 start_codon:yes stop_codon:yes gene_type:complete
MTKVLTIKGANMAFSCVIYIAFILLFFNILDCGQLDPKIGSQLTATDLDRVKVGARAPGFTLENETGRRISLADFIGKRNVVLVFYRSHW